MYVQLWTWHSLDWVIWTLNPSVLSTNIKIKEPLFVGPYKLESWYICCLLPTLRPSIFSARQNPLPSFHTPPLVYSPQPLIRSSECKSKPQQTSSNSTATSHPSQPVSSSSFYSHSQPHFTPTVSNLFISSQSQLTFNTSLPFHPPNQLLSPSTQTKNKLPLNTPKNSYATEPTSSSPSSSAE